MEAVMQRRLCEKMDVWSLGVCLFELAAGEGPQPEARTWLCARQRKQAKQYCHGNVAGAQRILGAGHTDAHTSQLCRFPPAVLRMERGWCELQCELHCNDMPQLPCSPRGPVPFSGHGQQ